MIRTMEEVALSAPSNVPVPEALVEEFLAAPFGRHSPALQRLLLRLRSLPAEGKHVLVEVEPFRLPGGSWRSVWRAKSCAMFGNRPSP